MPTYEYECAACGETVEIFQQMSEAPKRKCPSCGALRMKRLISGGGGIIFKGSGFYITDYRSQDYKDKAKAEADSAKGTTSDSSEKKSEGGSSSADSSTTPEKSSSDGPAKSGS